MGEGRKEGETIELKTKTVTKKAKQAEREPREHTKRKIIRSVELWRTVPCLYCLKRGHDKNKKNKNGKKTVKKKDKKGHGTTTRLEQQRNTHIHNNSK